MGQNAQGGKRSNSLKMKQLGKNRRLTAGGSAPPNSGKQADRNHSVRYVLKPKQIMDKDENVPEPDSTINASSTAQPPFDQDAIGQIIDVQPDTEGRSAPDNRASNREGEEINQMGMIQELSENDDQIQFVNKLQDRFFEQLQEANQKVKERKQHVEHIQNPEQQEGPAPDNEQSKIPQMNQANEAAGKSGSNISNSDFQEQQDDNPVDMPAYRESRDEQTMQLIVDSNREESQQNKQEIQSLQPAVDDDQKKGSNSTRFNPDLLDRVSLPSGNDVLDNGDLNDRVPFEEQNQTNSEHPETVRHEEAAQEQEIKQEPAPAEKPKRMKMVAKTIRGGNIYVDEEQLKADVPFDLDEWPDMVNYGQTQFLEPTKVSDGVYEGHCLVLKEDEIVRQGFGKINYDETGDFYEGWWLNNNRHGMGKMTYANEEMFYGMWIDDVKFSGTHVYKDGTQVYTDQLEQQGAHPQPTRIPSDQPSITQVAFGPSHTINYYPTQYYQYFDGYDYGHMPTHQRVVSVPMYQYQYQGQQKQRKAPEQQAPEDSQRGRPTSARREPPQDKNSQVFKAQNKDTRAPPRGRDYNVLRLKRDSIPASQLY